MPPLKIKLHEGFVCDKSRTWRQHEHTPHLRQGSVDAASAHLCMFMALTLLGIASKDDIRSLRHGTDYLFGATWTRSLESFFTGANSAEVLDLLRTLKGQVAFHTASGSTMHTLDFARRGLNRNDLVILGLECEGRSGKRWTLGVGTESLTKGSRSDTTSILCLDPGEAPPSVAQFNARLRLNSPRRGSRQLHYAVPGAIQSVSCDFAICLRALARRSKSRVRVESESARDAIR